MPAPSAPSLPDVLALLDGVLDRAEWEGAALGGPRSPPARRGEPEARRLPFPRLAVVIEGTKRHVLSRAGERVPVAAQAGQVIHWATMAWDLDLWDRPCRFLGLVFRRDYLRVLDCRFAGGPRPRSSERMAHHTRLPLRGAALDILAALDALAATGPDPVRQPAIGGLLRSLVVLARAHVAEDLAGGMVDGARRTWQEAIEWLDEHLAEPVSRESVASALGLHPSYVSSLFSGQGGAAFQRTLERLRLERARALIAAQPCLSVGETARRCGYPDAGHFIRVFRRRFGITPGRHARRIAGGRSRPPA